MATRTRKSYLTAQEVGALFGGVGAQLVHNAFTNDPTPPAPPPTTWSGRICRPALPRLDRDSSHRGRGDR